MRRRPLFTLAVLALFAACGAESSSAEGADAADGTGQTATESRTATSDDQSTAGDASPSDAAPGPASKDRCAEARFGDTEPFASHGDLPFDFEVPAGWDRLDSSQGVGSVAYQARTGRRSSTGMIPYVFGEEPLSSPNVTLDMYRQSMEQIGTVTLGAEEIEVFGHDLPGVVNAKFLFPDRRGLREASFIFGAASDACLPERRRLRDLVLGSVADRS